MLKQVFRTITAIIICTCEALATELSVGGMLVSGLVEESGSGLLDEVLLDYKAGAALRYDAFPPKRASLLFEQKEVDCIYPGSIAGHLQNGIKFDPEEAIESELFFHTVAFVVSKDSANTPRSLDDLRHKSIAQLLGTNFQLLVKDESISWFSANDNSSKYQMLEKGRVDFMIYLIPHEQIFLERAGFSAPSIDGALKIHSFDIGIVCHDNEATRLFISRFNEFLRSDEVQSKHSKLLGYERALY